MENAYTHFQDRVHGSNFMTPSVEEVRWIVPGRVAYELSVGTGMERELIYGITTDRFRSWLSKMFWSRDGANCYVAELRTRLQKDG